MGRKTKTDASLLIRVVKANHSRSTMAGEMIVAFTPNLSQSVTLLFEDRETVRGNYTYRIQRIGYDVVFKPDGDQSGPWQVHHVDSKAKTVAMVAHLEPGQQGPTVYKLQLQRGDGVPRWGVFFSSLEDLKEIEKLHKQMVKELQPQPQLPQEPGAERPDSDESTGDPESYKEDEIPFGIPIGDESPPPASAPATNQIPIEDRVLLPLPDVNPRI